MTRRTFAMTAVTAVSSQRVWGANDRVRIGLIGAGGRGRGVAQQTANLPGAEFTGVCDVNPSQIDKAKSTFAKDAQSFSDFRTLLASPNIDAVLIGSPDHWHVPMTIAAVEAGKDVYVEKPLTKTIAEGDAVIRAVEASKRVVQVGYQQRSTPHYPVVKRLVEEGALGTVSLAETYWYQDYLRAAWTREVPAADGIDWKGWQGSAPAEPFSPLVLGRWRWFWNYGGGHLTDLFSHWVDSVHWILDDTSLVETSASGHKAAFQDFECPDTIALSSKYRKGHLVTYQGTLVSGIADGGIVLRGSKGVLNLKRSGFEMFSNSQPGSAPPVMTMRATRDGTIDHIENWLDCIKTRKTPNSSVRDAVLSANAAHAGNQSYREGRRLTSADFRWQKPV
jgi:predicted dehydrogenase